MIDDRPALEVLPDPNWARDVLPTALAHRSLDIIERLGHSPAGTAAQAILGTVRSLSSPTPYGQRFSAGVVSDGSYGVPRGLGFGFPLRSEDGRTWSIVQGIYHDEYALGRIAVNVNELEHEAVLAQDLLGGVRLR